RPVSSSSSRATASTTRSPRSTRPPGSDQRPPWGGCPRRTSSTRGPCSSASKRTPPAASTGPSGLLAGEGLDLCGDLGVLAIVVAHVHVPHDAALVDDEAHRHRVQAVHAVGLCGLVLLVPDDREL